MKNEIKMALKLEILRELEKLKTLDPKSEEYKKVVDNLETLVKLYNGDDTVFKWSKLGVEVAGVILPLTLYAVFLGRGFKFEETGAYVSKTFMNLIGQIKPKTK